MRKRRITTKPLEAGDKVLDVSASMQGTLRFDDPVNLRINGRFEGTLDTKGMLMIGQGADITANISGESISIAGTVEGNIRAVRALSLESSARLAGDVDTPNLSIAEGAVLNGRIRMAEGSAVPSETDTLSRGDWMNTTQLAKYLEVDVDKINEWVNESLLPATREGGEWVFEKSKIDQWISDGRTKAKV